MEAGKSKIYKAGQPAGDPGKSQRAVQVQQWSAISEDSNTEGQNVISVLNP